MKYRKPGTASLADFNKAMASIPAPTCFADYGKVYRVLPGGGYVEIHNGVAPEETLPPDFIDLELRGGLDSALNAALEAAVREVVKELTGKESE